MYRCTRSYRLERVSIYISGALFIVMPFLVYLRRSRFAGKGVKERADVNAAEFIYLGYTRVPQAL